LFKLLEDKMKDKLKQTVKVWITDKKEKKENDILR